VVGAAAPVSARRVLRLIEEHKLTDFLEPPTKGGVLEASGVVAKGPHYYVIFDNIRRVARVHRGLKPGRKAHGWFGRARQGDGYEDIAWNPRARRFYLLIEAEKHPDGTFKAQIDECDEAAQFQRRRWVDFVFEKRNTGLEGLAAIRVSGQEYLLALCEGNRCRAGRKGRKPGGGRIQVLQRKGAVWRPVACIKLPRSVKFEDYAGVSLRGERIAVVSQASAKLWIGRLRARDWTIVGDGRVYDFPRSRRGKIQYCTVEGLCWLSERSFVMVSDLKKPYHSGRCAKKDQSIHLFALPGRAS